MEDFLGHELYVGDECVYMRQKKTDSGKFYWELEKGIIVAVQTDGIEMKDPDGFHRNVLVDRRNIVKVMFEE